MYFINVPPAHTQSYVTTELNIVVSAPQHSGMFRPLDVLTTVPITSCTDKAILLEAWAGSEGTRRLRVQDFKTIGTRRC